MRRISSGRAGHEWAVRSGESDGPQVLDFALRTTGAVAWLTETVTLVRPDVIVTGWQVRKADALGYTLVAKGTGNGTGIRNSR